MEQRTEPDLNFSAYNTLNSQSHGLLLLVGLICAAAEAGHK